MSDKPDWYVKEWRQVQRGLTVVYAGLFDRNRSGSEDPANVPVCIFPKRADALDMMNYLRMPGGKPVPPRYHQG